ncbi:DUF3343 domain-containing protein [Raoultibacter phocaeensis]|uniref:DUF3343 domain-containing protein n=1 Tax=Raoultibacter phocaeensis TaxID=2479841 RepID=UPI002102F0C0|nr:DUF3343 domain-containing protein [Raoultibacter phocaeensis]
MPRYLLAFESTHAAMAANRALASVQPVVMPTPRSITASCGMSLRFEAEDVDRAWALASSAKESRGLASLYAEEAEGYTLLRKL